MKLLKQEIRAQYRLRRREIPPEKKNTMDAAVFERIISMPVYRKAGLLLCYVSTAEEVETQNLIRHALENGKRVCVPLSLTETHTVEFHEIHSLEELMPGTYGVLEPKRGVSTPVTYYPYGTVCIVPGLVFDEEGYRLGYGKGYYDRFLQRFRGVKIGICYREFITRLLPHGYYDRPVNWLVDETMTRKIARNERMTQYDRSKRK